MFSSADIGVHYCRTIFRVKHASSLPGRGQAKIRAFAKVQGGPLPNQKSLSLRPEPERTRRRSGGTCFSFAFCPEAAIVYTYSSLLGLTWNIPVCPRFLKFRVAHYRTRSPCHSDRSRSERDGAVEEPAFLCFLPRASYRIYIFVITWTDVEHTRSLCARQLEREQDEQARI